MGKIESISEIEELPLVLGAGSPLTVCTAHLVDGREMPLVYQKPAKETPEDKGSAAFMPPRTAAMQMMEWMKFVWQHQTWMKKKVDWLGMVIWYEHERPSRGRRRTPMNVPEMVDKWKEVLVGLATAHDKPEQDRYEMRADELLTPLLAAPIKQIREFAGKLLEALKADRRVPFMVWRAIEIWVEGVVNRGKDEEIKELKTHLAREVAELVEDDVKRDVVETLVGVLQWRSPEVLERMRDRLKEGGTAKVSRRAVGRESCIFLVVDGEEDLTVML